MTTSTICNLVAGTSTAMAYFTATADHRLLAASLAVIALVWFVAGALAAERGAR